MAELGRPPGEPVRPLVEAAGVRKRFGPTVALADARLTVLPGESHALVGRNGAGKSTLVNVLTGVFPPDAGQVRFDGAPAPSPSDRDGWRARVACVYQKSTIVPDLTVAENLFINRQPGVRGAAARWPLGRGLVGWKRMRREAAELLAAWNVDVHPDLRAGDLGVESRQLVEIARALSFGARFIILDEPTAQLDSTEIERLFARMRALQESGVTFLFISHHLQEVYEVCQAVTVFRDARWITTAPVADLPRAALVAAMTGEAEGLGARPARPGAGPGAPVRLEVTGLTGPAYREVSLRVRRGEVVGLAGSSASGKVELAETLAGLRRPAMRHRHPGRCAAAARGRAGRAARGRRARPARPAPAGPGPRAAGRGERGDDHHRPARPVRDHRAGTAGRVRPRVHPRPRHRRRRAGAAGVGPVRR